MISRSLTVFLCFLFFIFVGCKSDDNDYSSLEIEATADIIQVLQNTQVEIDVLQNDINLPLSGQLNVSSAQKGIVEIIDPNNTSQNPSDDLIRYTPDSNYVGEDTFEYTICNEDQTNCATSSVQITVISSSTVVYNLESMPYPKLSDYNFFKNNLSDHDPQPGVIPYEPISTLFSDYAEKKRFIWMPNNTSATYIADDQILNFPIGTILIKAFYYNNVLPENNSQNIETRLMIRKAEGWVFANYIWNESQTEAYFDLDGGFIDISWNQNGENKTVNYRIPPESQCFTCHESSEIAIPIGLKPQNINGSYLYPEGEVNMLDKLLEIGYLQDNLPGAINTVVDWEDSSQPLNLRMRSYVDINCAHCHAETRYCDYRPIRFQFSLSEDPLNMGVCVDPDTAIPPNTKIVVPGNIEESLLYFRVNTTEEQYRMPLLGRTLIHEEYIALVEEWINSLNQSCD